jgi:hypothetical protein
MPHRNFRRTLLRDALIGATLIVAAVLLATGCAHARTRTSVLVNDPQHPFSPRALARMQRWVDTSHLPVLPGRIMMSKGTTEVIAEGLAGDHLVALNTPRRFALMHELGHESQMFDGPGGSLVDRAGNYGHPGQGWNDQKIRALSRALHVPAASWGTPGRTLDEVAADAYAIIAINPRWRQWWGHGHWTRHGYYWRSTPTPYNFEANRRQFRTLRAILAR